MAKGNKTGGRKPGTPNRAAAVREAEIKASGLTPLEWMLRVMRDEQEPSERRDEMAKAAAPYVHPKLSSIEGSLDLTVRRHEEALDELERAATSKHVNGHAQRT